MFVCWFYFFVLICLFDLMLRIAEGLKVYPRHATAAKLQMQKIQEMEQLASVQGMPTDRNTLNKLMALHPGLNNQMNNNQHMASRGALSGSAQAALALTNYQNLLMRQNSMNSNANSLQQEASSSFNNSNQSPSSPFQGAAALIPSSVQNLPGSGFSSPHLSSRQPHQNQQLQQRSLSSNSLLQQTNPQNSQGALQQQMIQQLLQEMSNNSGGGVQQSLPGPNSSATLTRNGLSFGGNNSGAAPATSNVSGSHGPTPSRSNSFKAAANSDTSAGGGNNAFNQRAQDLPANLHLQEDMVQDIAREFTENGFFNNDLEDNMGYGWKA